ncbi:unnamed protein product [Laminaria digitata]
MSLFHDHDIDVLKVRATTSLHLPSGGVRKKPEARATPAPQARFANAGQGGGAGQGGQEIDTSALYKQIVAATGGQGACKVELDAQSGRPHSFRVTKNQGGSASEGSIEAIKRMTGGNLLRGLEAMGVEAATELRASINELKQQASIAVALRGSLGEAQKESGGNDSDGRETFETILAAATREGDEPSKLSAKRTAEILDVSEQAVSLSRERAKRLKNDDAAFSA